ncbi:exo-alpha-sialidase [Allokutzneria oryzae]|uniref:exo-alpha-sialidase n=1 Tax=Allokutzneria oryzae TaxID=1378989 RepID=A0ABV5ZPK5_9PSEU
MTLVPLRALVVALIVGAVPATAVAATPEFDQQVLYAKGTGGYSCFRIPAIVRAKDGGLLAFAEGRVKDCGDDGDIDLVVRRSTDGGATWGPVKLVANMGADTIGNPAPIVDRDTGRIVLLSTHNPGDNDNKRTPYVQYSNDNGVTWTTPRDIAAQATRPEWDYWYATGPSHGIQLRSGRMVVGGNHEGRDGVLQGGHLLLSDDGGMTWRIGAVDDRTTKTVKPQEMSPIELSDGRVLVAARDQDGTDPGHRAFATSSDGGTTFDRPFATDPRLVAPVIQGATIRLGPRLLFSAPAHAASREVMTVRSSRNDGRTWDTWKQGKVIHWGPAAYSDMVALGAGRTGLLYEGGTTSAYESIRFARFTEEYLAKPNGTPPGIPGPPAPGPTTPDRSAPFDRAYVRGGATTVDGHFDKALSFDGTGYVEIPYSSAVDLDASDFTVAAWFRYGSPSGARTILWAYRQGEGPTPGLWLRAEPDDRRLRAFLGAEQGTVTISSANPYNDEQWHHVVLQRVSGKFVMRVDGAEVASADAPAGSVTAGKEFGVSGVHIGQRLDGTQRFRGEIDEVRVYRRALSAHELNRLRTSNESLPRNLELHLPLDSVSR